MAVQQRTWIPGGLRATDGGRHLVIPRLVAGLPLLLIGLAHVFDESARMTSLVEAAGLPAVSVLSPTAVAIEIIAGALLLLGLHARVGSFLAIPTMAVAVYAHVAIDVWPNPNEPPIALPLIVIACAVYVLWRGAGSWSLDRLLAGRKPAGGPSQG